LKTMFLGLEAIDEEGLRKYRKRVSLGRNFEAVEFARSLGINVAINLIAEPDWDHERVKTVREWCLGMPDVINCRVITPLSQNVGRYCRISFTSTPRPRTSARYPVTTPKAVSYSIRTGNKRSLAVTRAYQILPER